MGEKSNRWSFNHSNRRSQPRFRCICKVTQDTKRSYRETVLVCSRKKSEQETLPTIVAFVAQLNVKCKRKRVVFLVYTMKAQMRSGGIAPPILNLNTKCTRAVNFTPQMLYIRERHLYQLNMRVGGPQNRSGRSGESILAPTGIRTPDRQSYCTVTTRPRHGNKVNKTSIKA